MLNIKVEFLSLDQTKLQLFFKPWPKPPNPSNFNISTFELENTSWIPKVGPEKKLQLFHVFKSWPRLPHPLSQDMRKVKKLKYFEILPLGFNLYVQVYSWNVEIEGSGGLGQAAKICKTLKSGRFFKSYVAIDSTFIFKFKSWNVEVEGIEKAHGLSMEAIRVEAVLTNLLCKSAWTYDDGDLVMMLAVTERLMWSLTAEMTIHEKDDARAVLWSILQSHLLSFEVRCPAPGICPRKPGTCPQNLNQVVWPKAREPYPGTQFN